MPPALANQIAAGEVVERPASVVKELVENSLDAGARHVDIEVNRGGLEWIRVRDDGHGIHPEDLELALERHATSKVRSQADLDAILSLGFRGEALPSIASVAGLRLISRVPDASRGHAIEFDPVGGRRERMPASHPTGTTVEVRGLFHDLPARRKFLRSERTEYLHILDTVQHLALSRPEVGVRFSHNGAQVLHCPAGIPIARRMATILGQAFRRQAISVDFAAGSMRLWGWLAGRDLTRSQSDRQYLYLNGRMIRDRLVNHAVRLAFADAVPAGRFPVYLLYLVLDAAAADVNVHPTKHEVRFRNARDVHDFISAGLRAAMQRDAAPEPRLPVELAPVFIEQELIRHPGGRPPRRGPAGNPSIFKPLSPSRVCKPPPQPRLGRPVAQLNGEFVLTERAQRWLLIDLRAARRLWTQARLKSQLAAGAVERRPLLVTVEFDLTRNQAEVVEKCSAFFGTFGLTLVLVAPARVAVREIPVVLPEADIQALARDLLDLVSTRRGAGGLAEEIIHTMLDHAEAPADPARAPETLAGLLYSIEDLGLDLEADACPGLWRTLDRRDLHRLLAAKV